MADDKRFDDALDELEQRPVAEGAGTAGPEEGPSGQEPAAVTALRGDFGDAIHRHEVQGKAEDVVFVDAARVREILGWLRDTDEQEFTFLLDLTAVDYGGGRPIQVVYQLYSPRTKAMLRVKAELALEALEIDSVTPIWSGANWLEREVFDLFGITFRGHPDMRRILMPENYAEGHPLRKDFPLRGRFTRAEQTRRALAMEVEDYYIPSELDVVEEARRHAEATGAAPADAAGTRPAGGAA